MNYSSVVEKIKSSIALIIVTKSNTIINKGSGFIFSKNGIMVTCNVEGLRTGAISLYGLDIIEIYQALISNVQLGIGYAVPSSYIPKHLDIDIKADIISKKKSINKRR